MNRFHRGIVSTWLALAAACAHEGEQANRADTTRAVPAAPAPGAANAARETPSDTMVTARGIGALVTGMTVAEASAALRGALVLPAGADSAGCTYAFWRGGPAGVRVMVENGRVARVDVDSAGIRTVAGAGVGDSEERVERLYGGRATVSPHKYEDGHYVTVTDPMDSTFALVFETRDGTVTRYRAGLRPQVDYVEGCG
jgi:hypothetical protein